MFPALHEVPASTSSPRSTRLASPRRDDTPTLWRTVTSSFRDRIGLPGPCRGSPGDVPSFTWIQTHFRHSRLGSGRAPLPSPFSPARGLKSQGMSRKRPRLVPETFGSRRRRGPGGAGEEPPGGEAGSVRRALRELGELFPRLLFQDALPPIALKSQVYSLVPDRTAADRQLRELRELGELVNAGVLTVRDAGSWWLSVPGAGRFVKYFVKGRQAVLGMVRKSKYRELLLSELLARRAPLSVRLGLPYHVHDLIGGQLLDIVPTTSGTLLRLPET